MKIIRTRDIPDDALSDFVEEIAAEIEVELDPQLVGFKSSDAPSWVKLAADLAWWQQALAGYAALYIAEIVKEAAKDTWRSRAKAISAAVAVGTKIKTLATASGKLALRIGSISQIVLFVPVPNGYFGTSLLLSSSHPELAELELALFTHHIHEISAFITQHSKDGIEPFTGYFLELRDDAAMKIWWYNSDCTKHDHVLPFP